MDSEFNIPGFRLYRKDRAEVNDKKGGGVALYVSNSLRSSACDELNAKNVRVCGVGFILMNLIMLL